MRTNDLYEKFLAIFGKSTKETHFFHSPGRVNLIGEHTDYNGGFVFPCALSVGTYAVIRKRDDHKIKFASTNFELAVEVDIHEVVFDKKHDWANYPKGVVKELLNTGVAFSGFEILFSGNIPNGAGLSSSASIELCMAVALNDLFHLKKEMLEMVKLSQKAENNFVGLNCGIMDQFAVGMGKKDMAMFLDCKSLQYDYVPIKLDNHLLIIADTNKRRGLADSKYNERRSECETAVDLLKNKIEITCLGDCTIEQFNQHKFLIENETVRKRAEHVVYEDERTFTATKMLKEGDLSSFGKLMNESHQSLKELYEVTGVELDTMVSLAQQAKGVLGARMTGAGFGGCTVSIVEKEHVEKFKSEVGNGYQARIGLQAAFYEVEIGDGAREVEGGI